MDDRDPEIRDIIHSLRDIGAYRGGGRQPPLNPPDDDGTSGDMEGRIATLEAHMEHVRGDLTKLSSVPVDLAGLSAKVGGLPDKDYIRDAFRYQLVAIGGVVAIVSGIVTVVAHFLGK